MTLQELSELYWLKLEINNDEERLKELRQEADSLSSPRFDGSTGSSYNAPKIEIDVADIVDLEAIIKAKKERCVRTQKRLERYIASIPNSYIRLLFTLRFVQGKSYPQIARKVGGITPDSARIMIKRYIEEHE